MSMFETLEGRQFMSVSVAGMDLGTFTTQLASYTTQASIPNVRGTFKGTFIDRGWHEQGMLGMKVTGQSGSTIRGFLFDNQGGRLSFTGTVRADHHFTIKTYGNTNWYKLTGQFNGKGTFFTGDITGRIAGKASFGAVWMSKI